MRKIGMKEFTWCYLLPGKVVQETLGFSPFELVFGHTVRGPLKLLKEKWLNDEAFKHKSFGLCFQNLSKGLRGLTDIARGKPEKRPRAKMKQVV